MRWLALVLLVLAPLAPLASCTADCPLVSVESSGIVRSGLVVERANDLERRADGNLRCTICDDSVILDNELDVIAVTPIDDDTEWGEAEFADYTYGAGDIDSLYGTDGFRVTAYNIRTGAPSWSYALEGRRDTIAAAFDGVYVVGTDGVTALSLDGELRWSSPVGGDRLKPDGIGGVFVLDGPMYLGVDKTSTITRIDATGATVWTKTLRAEHMAQPVATLEVEGDAGPDGSLVIAGRFWPALQIDTLALTTASETAAFAARIDAAGSITWSHVFEPPGDPQTFEVDALGEDAVVSFVGSLALPELDSHLVRVGAGGVARQLSLGGPGGQLVWSVVAGTGDELFVEVSSFHAPVTADERRASILELDGVPLDVSADNGAYYLLAIGL